MFTYIIGSQNPVVGKVYAYEISSGSLSIFGENTKYEWYLFKKQKNGSWRDVTGTPKIGKSVTYTFHEPVLGNEFELRVFETKSESFVGTAPAKKQIAKLDLVPSSSKTAQIDKVVLLNGGSKDVNKANYRDTLLAQAFCTAMFNQEVEFQLWEDDAAGGGHSPAINKNNRSPRIYKARVNEKGIAEAKIPLSSDERILKQIANRYLMKGDKSEGKNHEYYVTASYHGKIQKASKVNVDVANPDYNKDSQKSQPKASAKKPEQKKTTPQPQKPQPRQDTYKKPLPNNKPITGKNNQSDKDGRIIDVSFKNRAGKKFTTTPKFGETIIVEILTKNVIGKHYYLRVWEDDTIGEHDLLYEGIHKITNDKQLVTFALTKGRQQIGEIGNDPKDPDSGEYRAEWTDHQELFAEITFADISKESTRLTVEVLEEYKSPEYKKSTAKVKKLPNQEPKKGECFCNKDFEEKDVRKLVKLLKGSETIWEGQALKGGKRAVCNISDKSFSTLTTALNNSFKKYKINTCAQKIHFLAQVCEETGTFALSEETKSKYSSSQSVYKGRGILQLTGVKKNKNDELYNEPGPYKSYADYKGDQNIVTKPEIVATNVQYAIDSGGWIWSINKKMPKAPSAAVDRWGGETAGKSLNELAIYVDKYLELISALLNGRGSDGMPIGWEKRKSNYNLLKTGFFMYDWYHVDRSKTINAKDIITYNIYADGKIERHIPKKIKSGYEQKYKYVYHDINNNKNDICIVDWIEIDKVKHIGKSIVKSGYISHETFNVRGVNQKHVYKYADGSVIASGDAGEGGGTITRKYAKAGGKTIIVKVPEPLLYSSGNIKVSLKFENTIRTYMGRDHFAALIGALAGCGLSLVSEGSAMKDGTCFPSVSHTNGESIDTDYLILSDTQKYVNSMADFGFKTMLYKPGMKLKKPNGVITFKEDSHHSAHLHCGSSNIQVIEIKE